MCESEMCVYLHIWSVVVKRLEAFQRPFKNFNTWFKTSRVWRQRSFWPELRRSPAGSDPSRNHCEEPAAAHSCTMWPQALEHHELHMTGWQRSQLVAWPSLMQRLDGASGWDGLMVRTCREGMMLAWFTIDKIYCAATAGFSETVFCSLLSKVLWLNYFYLKVNCTHRDVSMCLLTVNTEQNALLVLACWVGSRAHILPSILQPCSRQLQHLATFNKCMKKKNTKCNICVSTVT